jgi:PWWP domain
MRETRMAQANDGDIQAHITRDRRHAMELGPTKTETNPENWPFFVHQLSSQKRGKFDVSDLVWGKVKSHPWWPGQIIDPTDASTLAIKCKKKDTLLVAYFWDKTFAWCDESQLKPFFSNFSAFFFSNFSAFETQADLDTFSSAVKSALKEVCRRIDAGTLCSCLKERTLFKVYPKMENAGVREGFEHYTVDRSEVVNSLNPWGLVGFIRDLALDPRKDTHNKLLLVMLKYHIKAFYRWMAFMLEKQPELVIVTTKGVNLPENTVSLSDISLPETPLMQISPGTPHNTPVVNSSTEKPKRKRGRPRKTPATIMASSDLSGKTQKALSEKRHKVHLPQTPFNKGFSGSDNMQDSSYWSETSQHPQADAKVVIPSAKRPIIIPVVDRRSDECIPTALLLIFSNRYCKAPSDMEVVRTFSQHGPLKGEIEKVLEGSQIRVKLVFKKRADAEMAFGSLRKQNVFGSSLLSYRLVDLPPSEVADSSEQEMVEVDGEDHGLSEERRVEVDGEDHGLSEERRVEVDGEDHGLSEKRRVEVNGEDHVHLEERTEVPSEFNPTTLLLSFSNKSGKIASEMELIRMFSHHGPLKEGGVEKEVEGTIYRFRIAFKKHSSAQMAFTSLRKQNVFGPSLLSYRLVSLPLEAKKSGQDKVKELNKEEHSDVDRLGQLSYSKFVVFYLLSRFSYF